MNQASCGEWFRDALDGGKGRTPEGQDTRPNSSRGLSNSLLALPPTLSSGEAWIRERRAFDERD